MENSWALTFFPGLIERLRATSWEERQFAVAQGLLTGNIFDWGASEAVRFFTQSQDSVEGMANFEQTLAKLQVVYLGRMCTVLVKWEIRRLDCMYTYVPFRSKHQKKDIWARLN